MPLQSGHQACLLTGVDDTCQPATAGAGPLLERDYWAELEGCSLKPTELMAHVKSRFCEFPPAELVEFVAASLDENAEIDILIRPAQLCRVRVVHADAQSLTLGTLAGHPEAGRITFGAYRHSRGAVIFHIRSRARAASTTSLLGFLAVGEAMQTTTWTDFINNLAVSVGARIVGAIHAETRHVEDTADDEAQASATFRAVGD
jgi:hypothetical protein